jgi:hypothetical protein
MGAHVPVQVGHVGEAFAANLAGECALSLVYGRDVALIFVTFVKTLVAYLNQELLVFIKEGLVINLRYKVFDAMQCN